MTTTVQDLVQETKRNLYAGARDAMNKLSGALGTGDTTVTFTYDLGAIQAGAYVSIGLEILYVWAVQNVSTKVVTVERAVLGSTAATHADGAVCTVNPRFPDFSILDALNNSLTDLSAPNNGLFAENEVTLTYNPAVMGYDLTSATDVLEVLEVKYDLTGPEREWPLIRRFDLKRNSDTGDFPSGFSLVLYESAQSGRDIRVSYASRYTAFSTTLTTAISDSGLQATANDLPPLGAAIGLQSMREGQRNFNESQPDTRRASEVPPGAQLAGVRVMSAQYQERVMAERSRLRKRWPYRRRV